jgi:hypothetical protein
MARRVNTYVVDETGAHVVDEQGRYVIAATEVVPLLSTRPPLSTPRGALTTARPSLISSVAPLPSDD